MKRYFLITGHFGRKLNAISNKIILFEEKIVRKDKNVAEVKNTYFINITKTLTIKSTKNSNSNDIMESISQFNDQVSIKKTKEIYPQIVPNGFTFSPVSLRDGQKEIMNPDVEKSSAIKSIPA